jgi:hypothetical protein
LLNLHAKLARPFGRHGRLVIDKTWKAFRQVDVDASSGLNCRTER